MPNEANSEFYFIAAMMVLIVILCVVAVYIFFRTYKKEMREKAERLAQKQTNASEDSRQK
jgi:flagellar basal body-associated protein FliL